MWARAMDKCFVGSGTSTPLLDETTCQHTSYPWYDACACGCGWFCRDSSSMPLASHVPLHTGAAICVRRVHEHPAPWPRPTNNHHMPQQTLELATSYTHSPITFGCDAKGRASFSSHNHSFVRPTLADTKLPYSCAPSIDISSSSSSSSTNNT